MDTITIGPFTIKFTPAGVQFYTSEQGEYTSLTYTECYRLFEELYQRRAELYGLTYGDSQQADSPEPQALNDLTYTVEDQSLSVGGWEREENERLIPPA